MGVYDRDYYREQPRRQQFRSGTQWRPGGGGGGLSTANWSTNTWLIVICVAVFVLDVFLPGRILQMSEVQYLDGIDPGQLSGEITWGPSERLKQARAGAVDRVPVIHEPPAGTGDDPSVVGTVQVRKQHFIESLLHFSTGRGFVGLEVWRLIGFQFLHSHFTIFHIVFNMLGLFWFGPIVEQYLGSKRYLAFYLLCGICGALMYVALNLAGEISQTIAPGTTIPVVLINDMYTPLIGASAGVFGVLMAAAFIAPRVKVLVFFVLPMSLPTLAYVFLGLAVFTVFFGGSNAGGEAAHIGGALAGFYFIRNPQHLHNFFDILGRVDPTSHHYRGGSRKGGTSVDTDQIDRILDKVRRHGIESLTTKEKKALEKASRES